MSIEQIVNSWKSEEDELDPLLPANPVGRELSEEELEDVTGGFCSILGCSCNGTEMTH
ncbi:MAG TPA: mersacidin/lichenicidin family type 2 lantibiotic [Ktedonobacteraceae bacterium]|nr:mersacidin/lichenicidin family type 2 lantibiotic [Ktedonobacteraceae bacterium]